MKSKLKITLVSDAESWKNDYLPELIKRLEISGHQVLWVHDAKNISRGDLAFYYGFTKIVPVEILKGNRNNVVIHESALPEGRGMSPLTWQILEGQSEIPITLFEAVKELDAGSIYLQERVDLKGTELLPEIRKATAVLALSLILQFVEAYPSILGRSREQTGTPTYYKRRRPPDSRLDPNKTIQDQFNLFRACDNDHYPAYFVLKGETYVLRISKKTDS